MADDGVALAGLLAENTLGAGADQHPAAVAVMANPLESTLDRLAADASAGKITVPVSRSYALSDVPAAFADFAAGAVGKLAITVA